MSWSSGKSSTVGTLPSSSKGNTRHFHWIFLLDIYLSAPAVAPYITTQHCTQQWAATIPCQRNRKRSRLVNLNRTRVTEPYQIRLFVETEAGWDFLRGCLGYAFSCHYPLRFHSHPLFFRFICALEDNLNLKVVKDHFVLLVQSNRVTGEEN